MEPVTKLSTWGTLRDEPCFEVCERRATLVVQATRLAPAVEPGDPPRVVGAQLRACDEHRDLAEELVSARVA